MLIQVSNNTSKLINPSDQDVEWLYHFLSFKNAKAEQLKRMGKKVWDTQVRLFSPRTYQFMTGMLDMVLLQAEKLEKRVEVVDIREPMPELPPGMLDELQGQPWTLRDYQVGALKAVLSPPKKHQLPGRGILWHRTGAGKSRLAPAIAYAFGESTCFLVHRTHLAHDVAERWEALSGYPAGRILSGDIRPGDGFTVATVQTLTSRLKSDKRIKAWAERVKVLEADECHVFAAKDAIKVVRKFPNARIRLGLSGTPLDRTDKRSLVAIGLFGPVIHSVTVPQLVEAGVLARTTVRLLPCYQTSPAPTWPKAYDELIVNSEARNRILVNAAKGAERPGMIFVQRLKHGLKLKKMCESAGLSVAFVNGNKDPKQRDRAIKDLAAARLDFIIATDVFNEGVNIPSLRTVVLAAGGQSPIKVLQQIGRALRREGDKDEATIYDVDDRGNKWLRKHARNRIKVCLREGYEVIEA